MRKTNYFSLLLLNGLIVSCGGRTIHSNKTFDSAGDFETQISKEQDKITTDEHIGQKQKSAENQQSQEPALTEEQQVDKYKTEFLNEIFKDEELKKYVKCDTFGCISVLNEVPKIKFDENLISPFEKNSSLEGTTTYKADAIVKIGGLGYNSDVTITKPTTLKVGINNKDGIGNANFNIGFTSEETNFMSDNFSIKYDNIDFTKPTFESNDMYVTQYDNTEKLPGNIKGNLLEKDENKGIIGSFDGFHRNPEECGNCPRHKFEGNFIGRKAE